MVSSSIPSISSMSESASSSSESDSSKSMSSRVSGYSWTKGEDGVCNDCVDADEGVLMSEDMDGCVVKIVTLGLMDGTWCGARKRLEI
jgi:hypothetical protein